MRNPNKQELEQQLSLSEREAGDLQRQVFLLRKKLELAQLKRTISLHKAETASRLELAKLHATIGSLRDKLQYSLFERKKLIQGEHAEIQNEIRLLKDEATRLRNKLNHSHSADDPDETAEQRKLRMVQTHTEKQREIHQLKETIYNLKETLERCHRETDNAVKHAAAIASSEIAELKATVEALKDQLRCSRTQTLQARIDQLNDAGQEKQQLHNMIQAMHEKMG